MLAAMLSGLAPPVHVMVEALIGASGPTPVAPGAKSRPVPSGIAKQLVQPVPMVAEGAPVETVPGIEEASGMRLSSPHGVWSRVKFLRLFPSTGEMSYHS